MYESTNLAGNGHGMIDNLATSLLLSLLGMGLVFAAIVLFWLFMSVLVRLAAGAPDGEEAEREAAAVDAAAMRRVAAQEIELRRRAAVVAALAALAMSEEEAEPGHFPLPPTALVSTWQAVMRARQMAERGSVR
jgi:Na+-transporting methylmalonyl-CoA/oxaloacetate decarboxylase gamma subunit